MLPNVEKYSQDPESEVYFLKLRADYFRYVAEVGSTDDRIDKAKARALSNYEKAISKSDELSPAHPLRLSLVLNYSVFLYEIGNEKLKAIEEASKAMKGAEDDIDNIDKQKASES